MTVPSVKDNLILKKLLAKDYMKYMEYANISEDDKMSYLNSKGIYLVNYIEQLFLRLFDEDIDEFIDGWFVR